MSKISELQREYWKKFDDLLRDSDSPVRISSPPARHYTYIPVGRSGFWLSTAMNTKTKVISVNLIIDDQQAKHYLELLKQDKILIEAEAGYQLEWHSSSKERQVYISIYRSHDPQQRSEWPVQHAWLKGRLETFYRVFVDRIQRL